MAKEIDPIRITKNKDTLEIKTPHSSLFVKSIKKVRGSKWGNGVWVVPSHEEQAVYQIIGDIYNYNPNNDLFVRVRVTAKEDVSGLRDGIYFKGYLIGRASGRDSGVQMDQNATMVSGDIASGGSVKNWETVITKGSVFELYVPSRIAQVDEDWECEIV